MIKIYTTLGPASLNKDFLKYANSRYIKLLRINLSHTEIDSLDEIISFIRKYSKIPICLDTEGAQIRTSVIKDNIIFCKKNKILKIAKNTDKYLELKPIDIYKKLKVNDILSIDFDGVKIQVVSETKKYFNCKILEEGNIASNKSILVNRSIKLDPFTSKDFKAFEIAKKRNIKNIALSFTSSKNDVHELRKIFKKKINIVSKIESKKGLKNLSSILDAADQILIDRGDLSKEVPIHTIPKMQKYIIKQALTKKTPVYVATNLLESMVTKREPTRAEVNDIYNTLIDGASGLVLAAETAIGKYPKECIDMIIRVSKTLES